MPIQSEYDWRRDEASYERQLEAREELEREGIILGIAAPVSFRLGAWCVAQTATFKQNKEAA